MGRFVADTEAPIIWLTDTKSWLIKKKKKKKTLMLGKIESRGEGGDRGLDS